MLTTLMAVLAAALFVAACNDAPSPTAPPPPTEGSTAAPGSASLGAGEPGGMPEADFDPGVTGQAVPVQEATKGGQPKVDVCHQEGNGGYHIINVAESAVPAHERHGDWLVTEEVCDGVDNDCNGTVDDGGVCESLECPCFTADDILIAFTGDDLECNSGPGPVYGYLILEDWSSSSWAEASEGWGAGYECYVSAPGLSGFGFDMPEQQYTDCRAALLAHPACERFRPSP